MKLRFMTVDVFTARQFGGNPLAVIVNAEGLETGQMQDIAAEFNLSETTFVLPPSEPSHSAQVRIFTPRAELPFAGHPNIGTAFVLATLGETYGRAVADPVVFEEKAGLVEIDLLKEGDAIAGARLAAPQAFVRGKEIPLDVIAAACSIDANDIETTRHQPCIAASGIPWVFAEVKTRAALAAAGPRGDVFAEHLPVDQVTGIHLYLPSDGDEADIQCRVFAPLHGVPEDPATGSANVILIGLLASLRPETDLTLTKTIAQGVDMGRPSLLHAEAEKRDGTVTGTWIGGACVRVMDGTLHLD